MNPSSPVRIFAKLMEQKDTSNVVVAILEPHHDDSAFALGGALGRGLFAKCRRILVTVFSESSHIADTAKIKPQASDVPAIRRAETRKFCKRLNMSCLEIGQQDVPIAPGRFHDLIDQVRREIVAVLRDIRPDVVLCPLPQEQENAHPHHVIICEACKEAVSEVGDIVFMGYDDATYSRHNIDARIRISGMAYQPILVELTMAELAEKISLMAIFETQEKPDYVRRILKKVPGSEDNTVSETLWIPKPLIGTIRRLVARPQHMALGQGV
jgi:LmbE family N-acetylglucosaminyl deacetylase